MEFGRPWQQRVQVALPSGGVLARSQPPGSCGVKDPLKPSPQSGGGFRFREPDGRQDRQDFFGIDDINPLGAKASAVGISQRLPPLVEMFWIAKSCAQEIDEFVSKLPEGGHVSKLRPGSPPMLDGVDPRTNEVSGRPSFLPSLGQRDVSHASQTHFGLALTPSEDVDPTFRPSRFDDEVEAPAVGIAPGRHQAPYDGRGQLVLRAAVGGDLRFCSQHCSQH